MTIRNRKAASVSLALGLLVVGGLLLQDRVPSPLRPTPPATSPGLEPTRPTGPEAGLTDHPTVRSTAAAWMEEAAPSSGTEPGLPLPPSGDYELELTPEQISAVVDRRYAGLFRSLRLPPDRQSRLRSLLLERQQAAVDAANSALLTGLNPIRDLPTINQAIAQAQADIDATLRQELGEQTFAAVAGNDRMRPTHRVIAALTRELSGTAHPLRPEQEKQLVQLLLDPSREFPPGDLNQAIFGPGFTDSPPSEQVAAVAAAVLSPPQLRRFRESQLGKDAGTLQPN